MSEPRLLIIDLDHTALGGHEPYAQFPPRFARFLDELRERGIQWATCTTWGVQEQLKLMADSAMVHPPACLCGASGKQLAVLKDDDLKIVAEHETEMRELDSAFRERNWPTVRQLFIKLLEDDLVNRLAFDYYRDHCIIDLTCREGKETEVWDRLDPLLESGEFYSFADHGQQSLSLLPGHMNKGLGVKAIQRLCDVGPEQTIIAGDGMNDLPMFDSALARWLVCPSNASPKLKDVVGRAEGKIASQPYSNGVIEAVEAILAECH